jgi:periplasmic divalent cation tolerance protein
MPAEFIIIFITAPSKKEARRIISVLINKKLIACGNILEGVDSNFIWKGKLDKARELLIILKTRRNLFKRIVSEVEKVHSYEVPEIIAMPIIDGSKEYLKWINENVKS